MNKSCLALSLVLISTTALAQDFVQCWSDQSEAPESIVRINIDSEAPSTDSEGNERMTRPASVAVGMDIVLSAEASGLVSDQSVDVTLLNDDIIAGEIKAQAIEGHPYLLRGRISANGTRDDGSSVRVEKDIECVRHSLSN